jgi:hypothetical protein
MKINYGAVSLDVVDHAMGIFEDLFSALQTERSAALQKTSPHQLPQDRFGTLINTDAGPMYETLPTQQDGPPIPAKWVHPQSVADSTVVMPDGGVYNRTPESNENSFSSIARMARAMGMGETAPPGARGFTGHTGYRAKQQPGQLGDASTVAQHVPGSAYKANAGRAATPDFMQMADDAVSRKTFAGAMQAAKDSRGTAAASVDVLDPSGYKGAKTFLTPDKSAGFSISPDGELNSVVSSATSPHKGVSDAALEVANENGAKWLSAFDIGLPEKYARKGYKEVARVPFNTEHAPPGWDYSKMAKHNGGKPDVVFMARGSALPKTQRFGLDGYNDAIDYTSKLANRSSADTVGAAAGQFIGDQSGQVGVGKTKPPEVLQKAYALKAEQMDLPMKDRIQPDPLRERFIDQDYWSPSPATQQDMTHLYPRNPAGPQAKLPKGDRARVLVDRRTEIADRLADKINKSGHMEKETRHFYHSDGPLYRGALKAGLDETEAMDWLNEFGQNVGATSPQTKVPENIRNATSAMAKNQAGIPHRQIVGPGSGGISERGYPMMTGPVGIHGKLLDQVQAGQPINRATNTKPFNFALNTAGNRSTATIDTHNIRGTLQTLNEIEPGAVPESFILPKFRAQYKQSPSVLTPDMIDDSLAKQMIPIDGQKVAAQTEYPVFADIFGDVSKKLGTDVAEAQSLGWFGMGNETNLGSAPKTIATEFDERLSVTAQAFGLSIEDAAGLVFRKEIPLLGVGGAGLLGAAGIDEAQAESPLDRTRRHLAR